MLPDVVYSVKPDDNNEELRYSLRSLVNIPHGRVFISGYMPKWITNVEHVNTRQQRLSTKYVNSRRNWYRANSHHLLSEEYIHMNDDFFIMKPMNSIPALHQPEDLDDFIKRHKALGSIPYADGAIRTRDMLLKLGIPEPYYSYELHVPMLFEKKKMSKLINLHQQLNKYNQNIHTRTFYGNYYKIGGEPIKDVKIHHRSNKKDFKIEKMDFISTSDTSFGQQDIGQYIREQFKEKSPYEL